MQPAPSWLQQWRGLYRTPEYGFGRALLVAGLFVAAATAFRLLLSLIGPTLAFATYFPAILIATLIGGRLCGLLTIPLSVIVVWWAFIDPPFAFGPVSPVILANFTVFALSSLLIVALAVFHRNVVRELESKERERKLLADEIRHRGQNVLAIVLGLVRQSVRDASDASRLEGRIRAAIEMEDILEEKPCAPVTLRSVLETTVRGPHGDRVSLDGPDYVIGQTQARNLRLAFHEMATNALKYGALSVPNGRIEIRWTATEGTCQIEWRERDGPKVSAPAKANFGSKLIRRTLAQAGATMVSEFAEKGYRYEIVLPLDGR